MEGKQNYLLVGLFMLLSVTVLFGFVIWLSGGRDQQTYGEYHTYFTDSVTGLVNGAPVKYRGVDVGKVSHIAIDKDDTTQIEITLRIADGTPLTQDTVAVMRTLGITGVNYVELEGGRKGSAPLVRKGDAIPVIMSRPSELSQIVSSVPEIMMRLSHIADQMGHVLNDENMAHISSTLANIDRVTKTFGDDTGDIATTLKNASKAMEQLAATAATVNGLADASRSNIQNMLKDTSRAMEQLTLLLEHTNNFTDNGYRETSALLLEMKKTAREIRDLAQSLKEDPSRVVIPDKPGGVAVP